MNIFTELNEQWRATLPKELLNHAPTVLRRIEAHQAEALREVFSARSLAELVNHPLLDWLWRTYERFRAGVQAQLPEDAPKFVAETWLGRGTGAFLGAPLSALSTLTAEHTERLETELNWVTVRDAAVSPSLEAARAIHRAATGGPVSPFETVDRPLPDFFSGGVRNYKDRMREAAGLPQRSAAAPQDAGAASGAGASAARVGPWPAPAPPPAPPAAPTAEVRGTALTAAPEAPRKARGSIEPHRVQPPPDPQQPVPTDPIHGVRPAAVAASFPRMRAPTVKGYSPDGKYMPVGGGTRGWHNNAGVARNERSSGYHYAEAIDSNRFAHSGVENRVQSNMRGSERKEVRMQVRYGRGEQESATPGLCLDISLSGSKIRIGQKLREGTAVSLAFVDRDDITGIETPLLALSATTRWSKSVDKRFRVQRYDCGVEFDTLDLVTKERLSLVLSGRLQDLIAPAPAAETY